MDIETLTYNCSGCGKCVENCPHGVFTMVDNGSCRFVNIVDESLCSGCKRCENLCPNKAIKVRKTNGEKEIKYSIMKNRLKFMAVTVGGIAIMALLVTFIMILWNCIIPSITGWSSINYWQVLGLAVLFRLLTGHLSPHMFHQRGKNHFHEKMRGMPISERKAFIRRQLSKLTKEDSNNE